MAEVAPIPMGVEAGSQGPPAAAAGLAASPAEEWETAASKGLPTTACPADTTALTQGCNSKGQEAHPGSGAAAGSTAEGLVMPANRNSRSEGSRQGQEIATRYAEMD